MTDAAMLSLLLSLVGGLVSVLILIIGWLGNKFYLKLDEISRNLVAMAGELHERINGLDRRLVRVETRNSMSGTD